MTNILSLNNLSKNYGKKQALNNLNLDIEDGKVVGILGPNGSGKTTMIKILTGLLKASSGGVTIDGNSPGPETKAIVSYLPDRNFLPSWMKISDALEFYQDFYKDFNIDKARELLKFMDLKEDLAVESLSKGMHEKLNLSLVLGRDARLFILDEPIAGVDPVARDQILDAIINTYSRDTTMIITTHLVRDMERLFDDVVFLREGEVYLKGNAEDLREEHEMQIDDLYKEIFG